MFWYFYIKIIKTERQFDEDKIAYQHEIIYYKYNDDLGGWVKEDRTYEIDAQDVKKELKKPAIKKIGRSRNVFIFEDLPIDWWQSFVIVTVEN